MSDDSQRPIIVKRVKKAAHGHHGGAWKIAYADFVTAMMAFFLLMWLLGSTTRADLQGISDYFKTPLKVSLMGGSGAGDTAGEPRGDARPARHGAARAARDRPAQRDRRPKVGRATVHFGAALR